MWPFKKTDPLIRKLLDDYNINLLFPPRETYRVGDVCMKAGDMVQRIGSVTDLLTPPLKLPQSHSERVADISGQISGSADVNIALDFLAGFLNLIGAGGIVNKIKTAFGKNTKSTMKISFPNTTREFVDPIHLAKSVIGHGIDQANPIYKAKNRYYVAGGVLRTSSISLISDNDAIHSVNAEANAAVTANVSVQAKTQSGSESRITFRHKQKTLVYGVQLFELAVDESGNWSLGNSGYFAVRGLRGPPKKRHAFRPPAYARIGEADRGISVSIGDRT
jgi:hypothetical protein